MERELLRRVQLTQLEIAKEIRRVCEENDISYFLAHGTFLGAVRHQGFIPWDDDMDMGMLRPDYEKFCRIAPEKLKPEFFFQNWYTEPNYAQPFGKVMKRNTVYLEGKKTGRLKENGFYVDIFPFDNAPASAGEQQRLERRLRSIFRTKLMKSGYKPWMENGRILPKKRLGYVYYQLKALFAGQQELARRYDELATSYPESQTLQQQYPGSATKYFQREWLENLAPYTFEGEIFPGPANYDGYLTSMYGEYMVLPPEGKRENRHQIVKIDFGE